MLFNNFWKKTLENCEQTLPAGFDLARVTTYAIVLAWTRSCEYSNHKAPNRM